MRFPRCFTVFHLTPSLFTDILNLDGSFHFLSPTLQTPILRLATYRTPYPEKILCYVFTNSSCCFHLAWHSLTRGHELICSVSFWQTSCVACKHHTREMPGLVPTVWTSALFHGSWHMIHVLHFTDQMNWCLSYTLEFQFLVTRDSFSYLCAYSV